LSGLARVIVAIRDLTIQEALLEKLSLLEQENDRTKAANLFSEAEGMALDALLTDEPLFKQVAVDLIPSSWSS
jgi:hypothetical protein